MHVLINEADLENGLTALNDHYEALLGAIPLVYRHLVSGVTKPLLMKLCLHREGINLDELWIRRLCTLVSLKQRMPIPEALVLKDHELHAFILVCRLMKWGV